MGYLRGDEGEPRLWRWALGWLLTWPGMILGGWGAQASTHALFGLVFPKGVTDFLSKVAGAGGVFVGICVAFFGVALGREFFEPLFLIMKAIMALPKEVLSTVRAGPPQNTSRN